MTSAMQGQFKESDPIKLEALKAVVARAKAHLKSQNAPSPSKPKKHREEGNGGENDRDKKGHNEASGSAKGFKREDIRTNKSLFVMSLGVLSPSFLHFYYSLRSAHKVYFRIISYISDGISHFILRMSYHPDLSRAHGKASRVRRIGGKRKKAKPSRIQTLGKIETKKRGSGSRERVIMREKYSEKEGTKVKGRTIRKAQG